MFEFAIATAILIFTIMIGVPIAFAIGGTTMLYIMMTNPQNIVVMPIRMFSGINSFTLMALPLFVLAAEIMIRSGISSKLFDFCRIGFGRFRGGLAYVNVIGSTIFGSLSGAALSDVAGLGNIEIEAMKEDGYNPAFACALTAGSSLQSPLIPPSNIAILYAGIMSLSVGALLYAGLIPGLLLGLSQIIYIKVNAKRWNLPVDTKVYTKEEKRYYRKNGYIALVMPIIILVGITGGYVTPTEAAAVAVFYSLIIGFIVFKNVSLKQLAECLWTAAQNTANLFLITSLSAVFAWAISSEKIPNQIAAFLLSLTDNKYVMLFIINIILIIVGMWMETAAAVLLFAPILAPVAVAMGVHPVHFAVLMIVNLTLGLITPPVGVVLYAVSAVGKEKFENVVKASMPYVAMGFVLIAILSFLPDVVLFVPRLLGFLE